MREASHYESPVITVAPDASLHEIADKMDLHAVGCVVVVDRDHAVVGIVTDRDLLRRAIAPGRDLDKATASDVMTGNPEVGSTDEPLERLIDRMKARGVRRIPIVRNGHVAGIVTLDDLVAELGREFADLREGMRMEVIGSRRGARRRRRRERIDDALEDLSSGISTLSSETVEWVGRELDSLRKRLGR